jgi:hypothetical protein
VAVGLREEEPRGTHQRVLHAGRGRANWALRNMAVRLSEMLETRHQFHESLIELEQQTLGGLDLVAEQLG